MTFLSYIIESIQTTISEPNY